MNDMELTRYYKYTPINAMITIPMCLFYKLEGFTGHLVAREIVSQLFYKESTNNTILIDIPRDTVQFLTRQRRWIKWTKSN